MSEQINNKIDEYVLGRMKKEDLISFERQIETDSDLAQLVKERRALANMVDAFGDVEMISEIETIHTEEMKGRREIRRLNILKIAAAIAMLVAFSVWFWGGGPSHEQLYAKYYEPYKISFSERGAGNGEKILEADLLYKSGDYKNALPLFEEILSNEPELSKVELALGLCKMEVDDMEGALSHFEKLANRDFDLYKEHGLWYAAMVKLKNGDILSSKKYLEKVAANPQSVFYQRAKSILSGF